jgi:adenylate cyclase
VYRAYSIGAVLRSYAERREGRPPLLAPELFRDKIVFIAGTAAGTYDLRVTPLSAFTPGVLVHMTATDNLLHGGSLRVPPAAVFPATIVVLAVATSLTFVLLSRWAVKLGIIAAVAAGYYGIAVHAFTAHRLWLHLAWPEAAVALAYAGTATIEYFTEGRRRRQLRVVFDRYMGADVVEEITRNPDRVRLGGERRELTVFFSDVAGFTTLSEKLAPEALVELVNEYLAEMTAVIFHYRGNVNKYLGDGIMALFGAPLDDREHARLACFAALQSQEVLQRLRDRWREAGRPELHARIGINTGALVVGNVGSSVRMEYTVMGDSANLASRLEGANKFYGTRILLGPRTYESARAFIEAREVDLLRVKGKYEPVQVYELLSRQGMLRPEQRSMLDQYAAGLQAYKARRFADAIERFEGALRVMPTDGPARLYVERSRSYVATPPAADWDGVYELHEK